MTAMEEALHNLASRLRSSNQNPTTKTFKGRFTRTTTPQIDREREGEREREMLFRRLEDTSMEQTSKQSAYSSNPYTNLWKKKGP